MAEWCTPRQTFPSCLEGAEYEIDEKYGLTTSAHNVLFVESLRKGSSPFSTAIYLLPNIQIMANEQSPAEIFAKIKETVEAQKAEIADIDMRISEAESLRDRQTTGNM